MDTANASVQKKAKKKKKKEGAHLQLESWSRLWRAITCVSSNICNINEQHQRRLFLAPDPTTRSVCNTSALHWAVKCACRARLIHFSYSTHTHTHRHTLPALENIIVKKDDAQTLRGEGKKMNKINKIGRRCVAARWFHLICSFIFVKGVSTSRKEKKGLQY